MNTILLTDQQRHSNNLSEQVTLLSDEESEVDIVNDMTDQPETKIQEKMSLIEKESFPAYKENIDQPQHTLNSSKPKSKTLIIVTLIIVIIVIVTIAIALGVSLPIYLTGSSSSSGTVNRISINDIFNSSFRIKSYQTTWTDNNDILHHSGTDGIQLYSITDNSTVTIIGSSILEQYNVTDIKLSSSGDYALLISNYKKVYRHSFVADYYIISITDTSIIWSLPLTDGDVNEKIQYAVWSPTDNKVAFVYNNNVYTYDVTSNISTRHTDNGRENIIYNGVPDWVYEEEVLSSDHALWWSNNGSLIVYLTFNDTAVQSFQYPIYGASNNVYTTIESLAYPKAGTTNPVVKASLLSLTDNTIIELLPPPNIQYYIIYVVWSGNIPLISWMDRSQQNMTYCLYINEDCKIVYEQKSNAWIEMVQPPLFLDDSQLMILIDSVPTNNDDSYLHLVQIDTTTSAVTHLTQGEWEVTNIIGTTDNDILYISTETQPWQRHIYSTNNGKCLTCDQEIWINNGDNLQSNECHYWQASCAKDPLYCILTCNGPTLPFIVLVQYNDEVFQPVKYFETNSDLQNVISDFDLPTIEEIEIPADGDLPSLYARAMFPPKSNKKCSNNYPILFYVYGGPYSQMIGQYSVISRLFPLYLSSSLNMIVISVDGRGTGYRGDNFKQAVYRKLGLLESDDQIRAAQYFQKQCYINDKKIAIYGSSYGGYMAGMVGAISNSVFSTAISQSPVTDWHYYDTIYTERYMGLPTTQDNENGYKLSSLLTRASNLSSVDYLLIHGTGDDNVHFQNSAQLVEVLTENDIDFRLQFYTDQTHSLSETPKHLYQLIEKFLIDSFN